MDDVGPGKTVTEAQVSVPGDADGELAHPASWKVVAERGPKRRQIRRLRVEPVALRLQEDDVEAVGEPAPGAQVPRVGLVPRTRTTRGLLMTGAGPGARRSGGRSGGEREGAERPRPASSACGARRCRSPASRIRSRPARPGTPGRRRAGGALARERATVRVVVHTQRCASGEDAKTRPPGWRSRRTSRTTETGSRTCSSTSLRITPSKDASSKQWFVDVGLEDVAVWA